MLADVRVCLNFSLCCYFLFCFYVKHFTNMLVLILFHFHYYVVLVRCVARVGSEFV